MDNDLLIPLIWTVVFGTLIALGFKRLTKKQPTGKKWIRKEEPDKRTNTKT